MEAWSRRRIVALLKSRWQTEPAWPRGVAEQVKQLRSLRDQEGRFTVVIPYNPRAAWWGDVEERIVDLPVPIPSTGEQILMAWRLGSREEGAAFRKQLKEGKRGDQRPGSQTEGSANPDGLEEAEAAFEIPGTYHRYARHKYSFVLTRLRDMVKWDEVKMVVPDKRTPEVKDPDGNETNWHPVLEEQEVDTIKEVEAIVEKASMDGALDDENVKRRFKRGLARYRRIAGATVMGSVKGFEVRIRMKDNWKDFHAKNRGGDSKAEEDEMARQIGDLWTKGFIEVSEAGVSSNLKMAPKPGSDKLSMCTNYWRANKEIQDFDTPMPDIQNTLMRLGKARWFTVIDLR